MTRKQKRELIRILIALVLFAVGLFLDGWWEIGVMAAAWLAAGYRVGIEAFSGIFRRFVDAFFTEALLLAPVSGNQSADSDFISCR